MWTNAEVIGKGDITKDGCLITIRYSTDDPNPRTFVGNVHIDLDQDAATLQAAIDQQLVDLNAQDTIDATNKSRIDTLQNVVDKIEVIVPPPPPPPTPDEIALATFQARVVQVVKLSAVVDATDPELVALKSQNMGDLKTHPEWKDLI